MQATMFCNMQAPMHRWPVDDVIYPSFEPIWPINTPSPPSQVCWVKCVGCGEWRPTNASGAPVGYASNCRCGDTPGASAGPATRGPETSGDEM